MSPYIQIEVFDNLVRVTMPSRKIWQLYSRGAFVASALIFIVLAVTSVLITFLIAIPWLYGVIRSLQRNENVNWVSLAALIWAWFFPFWLVYAIYFLARITTRVEILEMTNEKTKVTVRQLGICRIRTFVTTDIHNLEMYPVLGTWHARNFIKFGITPGSLGFRYNGKSVRFGKSLADDEASRIFQVIRNKFPSLVG